MSGKPGQAPGEIWALRQGERKPLVPVTILNPGTHYNATITIALVSDPHDVRYVRRGRLPCKWAHVEEWMAKRRDDLEAKIAAEEARAAWQSQKEELELGSIQQRELWILAELNQLRIRPIAYDVKNAALAVNYSQGVIYEAIRSGALTARYANSKAIIPHEELDRWVRSLPTSPPYQRPPRP